ncbi:hypothetical protein ACI2JA_14570 [Alkalihalobacillus sp. NPDC078783]
MSFKPIEALGSLSHTFKASKAQTQLQQRVQMNEVMMAEAGKQAEQLARKQAQASDFKKEARFQGSGQSTYGKKNSKKKQNKKSSAKSQHPTKGTHIDYSM